MIPFLDQLNATVWMEAGMVLIEPAARLIG